MSTTKDTTLRQEIETSITNAYYEGAEDGQSEYGTELGPSSDYTDQLEALILKREDDLRMRLILDVPHRDSCAMYKGGQTDSCDCGVADMQIYISDYLLEDQGEEPKL